MPEKNVLLIIDDDQIVHKLLQAMLKSAGHAIVDAFTGPEGLDLANRLRPDLIMLDIMMPGMDGFEVIGELKKDPKTRDIPVIFLSAKTESSDKARGLELGAADYVNKPFDRAELTARIRTQLKLREQEAALRKYSADLEKMVEERTRQLIHADRLASLGTLSAGIAHEINNPTTFITGNLQTMVQFWEQVAEYLGRIPEYLEDRKIQFILKEFPAMINAIEVGASRISAIVSGLKTFSRKGASAKEPTNLATCVDEALQLTHNRLKYQINVLNEIEDSLPPIWANSQQIVQVFVNLILNSADAIGVGEGSLRIAARAENQGRTVRILFSDNGSGMSKETRDKIFDPFYTTKPVGQGTGLGLSIAHGIIQDHHGTIKVASEPQKGATFTITLPTEPFDEQKNRSSH